MANPNDWSRFYNDQSFFNTTSTTTTNVTTVATATSGNAGLSPEGGRVTKPARRRSRASRRTPTTLLNTDTANFRAMVQQFTGGPSAMAFSSSSGSGFNPTSSSNTAGGGVLGGQQPPPWQFPYLPQAHAPPRPYMFSLSNANPALALGGVNPAVGTPEDEVDDGAAV